MSCKKNLEGQSILSQEPALVLRATLADESYCLSCPLCTISFTETFLIELFLKGGVGCPWGTSKI